MLLLKGLILLVKVFPVLFVVSFHISDHETCGQMNFLSSEKLEGRQSI